MVPLFELLRYRCRWHELVQHRISHFRQRHLEFWEFEEGAGRVDGATVTDMYEVV